MEEGIIRDDGNAPPDDEWNGKKEDRSRIVLERVPDNVPVPIIHRGV